MKFAALLLFTVSAWAQNWPSNCVMETTTGWVKCPTLSPAGAFAPPAAGTPPAVPSNTAGGSSVWVGAGLFQGSPHMIPAVFGAARISGNTWSFNAIEFQALRRHPFTLQTSMEAGVAQRLATVQGIDLYGILGAGPSVTGSTAGGSFAGGFLGQAQIGKSATVGVFGRVQQVTGSQAASSIMLGIVVGLGK
jgi:hypothetical protein